MKPPPPDLPTANSRKWHSRRAWDQLGYLRVRSLGNPEWQRETEWLARLLTLERDGALPEDHALYDEAIRSVRRYPRTASGLQDEDASWEEVLVPIDLILERRQARHIDNVRASGVSGTR